MNAVRLKDIAWWLGVAACVLVTLFGAAVVDGYTGAGAPEHNSLLVFAGLAFLAMLMWVRYRKRHD